MRLKIVVEKEGIDADPLACSKIEGMEWEYFLVKAVTRLTPRTHYNYGEPVYLEMQMEMIDPCDVDD